MIKKLNGVLKVKVMDLKAHTSYFDEMHDVTTVVRSQTSAGSHYFKVTLQRKIICEGLRESPT